MAKVIVNYDTKEKTMEITIDGKAIKNVSGANFWMDYEGKEAHMSIGTTENSQKDGMQTYTSVCASEGIKVEKLDISKELSKKLLRGS